MEPCILCASTRVRLTQPSGRFIQCLDCDAAFRPKQDFPNRVQEKTQYDFHENDPQDADYRAFLHRCLGPLKERISDGSQGLDYGCGPDPATPTMLPFAKVACFDPFYFPDASLLSRSYEFIICTETAEHFHHPDREFAFLFERLIPGGHLALMTRLNENPEKIETWWYTRDPTHVIFYHENTFSWLESQFPWTMERPHRDVAIFQKTLI